MDWLIKIGQLLMSLSLLVLLHEGGHFLAARLFKTKVEKFYLFFDFLFPFPNIGKFSLFKFKKGDTEYGLGWFPLGGYVKIAGMLDESADKEALKLPPQPWEFRSKPAWQRLIIILGGIIVNVIVGIFIFSITLFVWGEDYIRTADMKNGIWVTDSMSEAMGLQNGDKIIGLDGKPVEKFNDVRLNMTFFGARTLELERNGETKSIAITDDYRNYLISNAKTVIPFEVRVPFVIDTVVPTGNAHKDGLKKGDQIIAADSLPIRFYDEYQRYVKHEKSRPIDLTVLRNNDTVVVHTRLDTIGKIGVAPVIFPPDLDKMGYIKLTHVSYNLGSCFPAGFRKSWRTLVLQAKNIGLMFRPKTGAYKHVGGFKSIASIFPTEWSWRAFWELTALLSLVLAFMNFLPIPMLDGGYMLFILYEMITRRKPSEKFMEVANTIGFIIVLALLLYANLNDFF